MNFQEITDYIFLDDGEQKGDIAFVFGTWNSYKESVQKAADIYKKGLVPKIILSGGFNEEYGVVEADGMLEELVNLGIPRECVLIENRSTNTLENVLFSIEIIEEKMGLKNIKSIVAIVKNYHARRALMTLRKHLPKNVKLFSAPYLSAYYSFTKNNWFETDAGKEKVLEEVRKIDIYLKKGDIVEL